jgi:hypothetical protein
MTDVVLDLATGERLRRSSVVAPEQNMPSGASIEDRPWSETGSPRAGLMTTADEERILP